MIYPKHLTKAIVRSIVAILAVYTSCVSADTIYKPEYSRMHPEAIKRMETLSGDHYDLRSEVPARMEAGQNGYVIITTKKKRDALKHFDAFVKHKQSRGFNVMTVTEDDFGGGVGDAAAHNIRKWLQKNYKQKNILYVLMLGNPHPAEGDVPFKNIVAPWREMREIVKLGSMAEYVKKNPDYKWVNGYAPTDYFYVDLTGDWDKNKNGLYADEGDYGEGGIDGQWEVLVGRIPYYDLEGFSGTADVDKQLARIIRYENEKGDLSWRHNMFYNGGVFSRDQEYYNEAMRFSGAYLFRQTFHGSSLPYEPESNFGHLKAEYTVDKLNEVNGGKFGMAYFQGHGFPRGGGGMSSNAAKLISDKFPKVYASGACDVAAPEVKDNMMNALLVSSGIASYGGTRSVTGCSSNGWLKHVNYYTYLYFGNSTGETLWRMRSMQGKERNIGTTNYLINLYGDPSIVPMPQVYGSPVSISPGWKTVVRANVGKELPLELPYEIRNNTNKRRDYKVKAHKILKGVPSRFALRPGEVKKFTVTLSGISKAKAGDYELPIFVMDDAKNKQEAGVLLKIQPKQTILYESFSKPALTSVEVKDASGNKSKKQIAPSEIQTKGVFGNAMIANQHSVESSKEHWASRSDFSISFFVHLKSLKGVYELLNCDSFRVIQANGKLECHMNTTRWSPERKRQKHFGPPLKEGWNFVSVSVDRSNQKVFMTVGEEEKSSEMEIDLLDNMDLKGLKIQRQNNAPEFYIDELTAHNHLLNKLEKKALVHHYVAKPKSPKYDSKVNNDQVFFSWVSSGEDRTFEFELADNPDFERARKRKLKEKQHIVSGLQNNKEYFWRVNFITPSGVRLYGESTRFVASADVKKIKLSRNDRARLPDTSIGVAGYNQSLRQFVRGIDRTQWDGTVFTKISGPAWLNVYDDGTLFTNYGATESDKGDNKFEAKVTAPDGQSMDIKFTIKVK